MDLSSIKPTTIDVDIKHPASGEKTGLVFKCISPQDPAAAVARRQLSDKARKKGVVSEADSVDFMAALVVGWTWGGDATWNGQKLDFTPANVKTVLDHPWVRSQVDEALGDTAAFFLN
jgi:hypothetical protein